MHLLFAKSFYSLLLFSSALALPLSSLVRRPNLNAALKERGTNWDGTYGEDKRDVHDALTAPVEDKHNIEHSDSSPESLDGNEWRRRGTSWDNALVEDKRDIECGQIGACCRCQNDLDWNRRRLTKRNDEEHNDKPQSLNGFEIDWTRRRSTKLSSNMGEKRNIEPSSQPLPPDSNDQWDWKHRRLLTERNDEHSDKPQSLNGFDIDWQKRNIDPSSQPLPPDSNNEQEWGRKRNIDPASSPNPPDSNTGNDWGRKRDIEPIPQPHSPADYDYEWGKRSSIYHPREWFVPMSSEPTAEKRTATGDKESGWNGK